LKFCVLFGYLGVHVVALSGAKDGSNPVDIFDIHPRAD
jgi:hypothetical protein